MLTKPQDSLDKIKKVVYNTVKQETRSSNLVFIY